MAARNIQVMLWVGPTADLVKMIRAKGRRSTDELWVYETSDPDVYAWARTPYKAPVLNALGLKLKERIPSLRLYLVKNEP